MSLRNKALGSLYMQVFLNVYVHFSISHQFLSSWVQSRLIGLPLCPLHLLHLLPGVSVCMPSRCLHLCCLYFSLRLVLTLFSRSSLPAADVRTTFSRITSKGTSCIWTTRWGNCMAWSKAWLVVFDPFWMSRLFAPKLFLFLLAYFMSMKITVYCCESRISS